MRLVCIDPHLYWPQVRDLIKKAMDRGIGGFDDIEWDILHDRATLWAVFDGDLIKATAVTQLTEKDDKTNCTIVACGGRDLNEWGHFISGLEDYARKEGCAVMRIIGRRGWQRVLKDYRVRSVTLEKVL